MEIKRIIINKNRGWRGLAEMRCYDGEHNNIKTVMFSFSQRMWNDMLRGSIVTQDDTNYYILEFDNTDRLPKGQRSVLIKSFNANVLNIVDVPKVKWEDNVPSETYKHLIENFLKNRNNHTQSDWNCIGIRVIPTL